MKYKKEIIKTLHLDTEKGQCILNGTDISGECTYLELEFNNGEWSLMVSLNKRYHQRQGLPRKKRRWCEVWITKKKFCTVEKRLADLETKVQSQQEKINQINHPYESLKRAFAEDVRPLENSKYQLNPKIRK